MSAQQSQDLWSKTTKGIILKDNLVLRNSEPNKAGFYQLDLDRLKVRLANAPLRGISSKPSNVIIHFPNAEGGIEAFQVKEAPVMVPEFQAKHPDMRAYVGQGIDNPTSTIRFSITPLGLHAITLSSKKGALYIDPYSKNGRNYIVYAKQDLPALDEAFICEVKEANSFERSDFDLEMARNADDGMMRTFRLALACSAEYGNFHGGTVGSIQTAMMTTMTRVNGIFERELSLHMDMIDNTTIIYFGDVNADPYTNNSGSTMLGENQTEIDAKIGDAAYDIGHVFSTGGGGIAVLPSPCITGTKAKGVTGLSSPVGDVFDVEYVAHEMGHQYGANHTFNGSAGNCSGGNRNASTAYEPGSGTTIMSYAGICSPQNVEENSEDYFHQISLQEIWANIDSGGASDCGALSATGNSAPTAEAGASYTIPIFTPYKLTGASTDADGTGSHTFTWEQWDLTTTAGVPTVFDAEGPLVRSFKGTDNPTRYIPRLEDLRFSSGGSTTWELLSVVDNREIDFQLTVRDNDLINGGQTATDNMKVTTTSSSGPFLVTSQDTPGISWPVGSTQTVTWDVANTDLAPVSAANVNIWLSTDGGLTFTVPLATGVPNIGTYEISSVPNNTGPYCRIMVEGDGNIFFNINDEDFAIGFTVVKSCTQYASNQNLNASIPDGTGNPGQGTPLFNTINVSDSNTIDYIRLNADISHDNISDLLIQIQHPDGSTFTNPWQFNCSNENDLDIIFEDLAPDIVCAEPTTGTYNPVFPLSIFNGLDSVGNWNIVVVDFETGVTGTLNDWYVEICSTAITPLDINEFDLANFSIFPNPNSGSFNIKLNTTTNNKIGVEVFDLRGRSIYNNSYNSNSNFNQTIDLNNAQSGMYLVKISDGERSATKKIIVK
jgi:subtilisin-like proprotein convertase family protein